MLKLWCAVALYCLVVACSNSEELPPLVATTPAKTHGDGPTPSPTLEVVRLGFSLQALHLANRVSTIAYGYDVLSGKVAGVALPFDARIGYGGVPPVTSEPGDPKDFHPSQEDIDRPPGRDYTVYSVEVIDPGTSGLAAGDVINLRHSGGIFEGKQYQYPGEPPLEVGASYILPLIPAEITSLGDGYSIGPAFAVFRIEDGSVKPLDSTWADLPAVRELTGKTPEEAIATIIASRDTAPSPPFTD